jgi:hypothetical protein
MPLNLNAPLTTRTGSPARVISTDRVGSPLPIIALVREGGTEKVYSYTRDGHFNRSGQRDDRDLINPAARVERRGFVNLYRGANGFEAGNRVHTDEAKARRARGKTLGAPVATVPVTYYA